MSVVFLECKRLNFLNEEMENILSLFGKKKEKKITRAQDLEPVCYHATKGDLVTLKKLIDENPDS